MFDIHPFLRPFALDAKQLTVVKPYDSTGPFGEIPTYKWRVKDILNAMMSSGLSIKHIEEMHAEDGTFWIDDSKEDEAAFSQQELDDLCNWKLNPLAALPQWLSVFAKK